MIFEQYFFFQQCRFSVNSQKKLIGYIRKLTSCHPLAQSLYQLLCKNEGISRNQKVNYSNHKKITEFLLPVSHVTITEWKFPWPDIFFFLRLQQLKACIFFLESFCQVLEQNKWERSSRTKMSLSIQHTVGHISCQKQR